ncbi:Holliday junction branch migration protein RuvA [Pseudooceanicola sp. C21-150M6]|uniref:Holliday junction branch migration protein RuvA n=1 Tax=Pseudooceanicola sp. C21-150M6 TaxID=3434355 RepID=UPI003D7F791E
MIGRVAGRIEMRGPDHVLIDVRGIGYIVFVSDRTLMALPGNGEAAALYTELVVREDLLQLYGFPTMVEKEWFRLLTSVQGVGAKGALAILGALGPDGLNRAIALGDQASVKAAKGIGPKTAQRIVLELKDKAPAVMAMGGTAPATATAPAEQDEVIETTARTAPPPAAPSGAAQAEALSALSNLGYSPSEAAAAVAEAAGESPEADTPALIRAALRKLAPKDT